MERRCMSVARSVAIVLAVVGVVAFGVVGVSRPVGAQGTLKIVFPTPPIPFYVPYFVAKDLGWLDKAGIKTEEVSLFGDANAIKAMMGGSGDIAAAGVFAAYTAIAEGAAFKAIASWQPTVDYVAIGLPKIKSYKDLKGATVAAGPGRGDIITEIFNLLMKKHGVDSSDVKWVSVGGHEARMKAVAAKKADVTLVGELFAAKSREFPELHAIGRVAEEFPTIGYIYLLAPDKVIRSKGPLLEKFIKLAVFEGSRYAVQNPDSAAEILRKRTPDLDAALVKEVVGKLASQRLFGINGGLEPAVTEYTLKLSSDIGLLSRPLRPDDVLDQTFVKKVAAELGAAR